MFTSSFLLDLRRRAIQKKVWYKSLDILERGIFTLSARVCESVSSTTLGVQLVGIVKKLTEAFKGSFVRLVEEFGLRKAATVAAQADKLGYDSAGLWGRDPAFAQFWAFLKINAPIGFSP